MNPYDIITRRLAEAEASASKMKVAIGNTRVTIASSKSFPLSETIASDFQAYFQRNASSDAETDDHMVIVLTDEPGAYSIIRELLNGRSLGTCEALDIECVGLPNITIQDLTDGFDGFATAVVNAPVNKVFLVADRRDMDPSRFLLRCVRSLLKMVHFECGHIPFHGGAISIGEKGCVLLGQKSAGKTTMILSCLKWTECRFVANSEIFVEDGGKGIVAHGLPMAVAVRETAFSLFPELANLKTADLERKSSRWHFSYQSIARLYGKSVNPSTNLSCFLIPCYEPARGDIEIREVAINDRFEYLCNCIDLKKMRYERYWDSLLKRDATTRQKVEDGLKMLSNRVPMFTLTQGEGLLQSSTAKLIKVIDELC